jgi:opacity protein-like surface antigen
MQRIRLLAITVALVFAGRAAALASTNEPPDAAGAATSHRAYIAVGGGAALGDLNAASAGHSRHSYQLYDFDTASGSISLRAGYRLWRHLAVEMLWDYQTGWQFHTYGRSAANENNTISAWNLMANAKGYLTDGRWQPYVLFGMGVGRRETDGQHVFFDPQQGDDETIHERQTDFVTRFGGGLEVEVAEAWTLGGEVAWTIGTGGLEELDYATTSVVLAYRFW